MIANLCEVIDLSYIQTLQGLMMCIQKFINFYNTKLHVNIVQGIYTRVKEFLVQ